MEKLIKSNELSLILKYALIDLSRNYKKISSIIITLFISLFILSSILTIEDSYFTGYIITQRHGNALHIWAAYNEKNDVLEKGLEAVKELALSHRLKKITFKSYRKAWDKVAPKSGFKREIWTYDL